MPGPYLSLVIPTRNDDYPSNILPVQNKCLSILQHQLEEARIESEIVVVEYNPDPSRPHLYETLKVGRGSYATIKIISVDPKYHRRFRYWEERPFHQTCAVNAGLRRSRGRFFVYRAADHIYSEALVRFLEQKTLLDHCIYRCDRFDIRRTALDAIDPDRPARISNICDESIVEWHRPLEVETTYRIPKLHTNACGDFLLMSRKNWLRVGGLREGRYPVFVDYDSLAMHASHALGNIQAVLPADCRVYKVTHGMKTVTRIEPVLAGFGRRLDEFWASKGRISLLNWSRMILNYPRRVDRTFDRVTLDSYERHFLLPALLWSHGFPFVRQNYGKWGLRGETLREDVLVKADWDRSG